MPGQELIAAMIHKAEEKEKQVFAAENQAADEVAAVAIEFDDLFTTNIEIVALMPMSREQMAEWAELLQGRISRFGPDELTDESRRHWTDALHDLQQHVATNQADDADVNRRRRAHKSVRKELRRITCELRQFMLNKLKADPSQRQAAAEVIGKFITIRRWRYSTLEVVAPGAFDAGGSGSDSGGGNNSAPSTRKLRTIHRGLYARQEPSLGAAILLASDIASKHPPTVASIYASNVKASLLNLLDDEVDSHDVDVIDAFILQHLGHIPRGDGNGNVHDDRIVGVIHALNALLEYN
jgi:hypothetical protein